MASFKPILVTLCFVVSVLVACQPPDCDRLDCGSCGNACCNMQYGFGINADDLMMSMQKLFAENSGGPDGLYTLQPMAEGSTGFADLRPYNKSVSYIGQVWHMTQKQHFNDTIDMTLAPDAATGGSFLKIFSISQIGGAYCDDGQNYKNIIQLVKALNLKYDETNILGCAPA